ncbi:hypothetical protein VTI28DRAFT_2629 [Corynascus sepedonium]
MNKVVRSLSITHAFIALVIFTGIGTDLLFRVAGWSVAVFVESAVEHKVIARSFGVRKNYVVDQSQELTYYGATNGVNRFVHAVEVGGAMSRAAVNSACNVRSLLSSLIAAAVFLISIYELLGSLFWEPKATLAAIIVTACWPLISSPSVFYRYWRTSLADFVSSMVAFLGLAIYLDQRWHRQRRGSTLRQNCFSPTRTVKLLVLDTIETRHSPALSSTTGNPEAAALKRNWVSAVREQRVVKLRRREGIAVIHPTRLIIVDFQRANHVDTTACGSGLSQCRI